MGNILSHYPLKFRSLTACTQTWRVCSAYMHGKNSPQVQGSTHSGCLHLLNGWGIDVSAQDLSMFGNLLSTANLKVHWPWEGDGHSPLQAKRAPRVSLWTGAYSVTKELAVVTVIFHPGHIFFESLITKILFYLGCCSGNKNNFPRLFIKTQELVSQQKFLGEESASDKLKRSSASCCLSRLRPNEHFWGHSVARVGGTTPSGLIQVNKRVGMCWAQIFEFAVKASRIIFCKPVP